MWAPRLAGFELPSRLNWEINYPELYLHVNDGQLALGDAWSRATKASSAKQPGALFLGELQDCGF